MNSLALRSLCRCCKLFNRHIQPAFSSRGRYESENCVERLCYLNKIESSILRKYKRFTGPVESAELLVWDKRAPRDDGSNMFNLSHPFFFSLRSPVPFPQGPVSLCRAEFFPMYETTGHGEYSISRSIPWGVLCRWILEPGNPLVFPCARLRRCCLTLDTRARESV